MYLPLALALQVALVCLLERLLRLGIIPPAADHNVFTTVSWLKDLGLGHVAASWETEELQGCPRI